MVCHMIKVASIPHDEEPNCSTLLRHETKEETTMSGKGWTLVDIARSSGRDAYGKTLVQLGDIGISMC